MAWNDQLGLVEKWTTGPAAFAHSRAGVRWIAALVATSLIFFLGVQVYHKGAYTYPSDLGLHHILPVGSATSPQQQRPVTDGAGGTRSPAWIDTPPAFDVSRLPAHSVSTASLDRDPALPPRLAEAMAAFLARPVLGHEEAEAQNEAACPPDQLDRQVNADQLRDSREGWLAVDEAQITGMRQGALEFLEARARDVGEAGMLGPGVFYNSVEKMVPIEKGSRGVVIAAGNHRTVERAVVCVREMQRLGWKGAVEVWHFEGELTDEADREILTGLGVAIHMVSVKKSPGQWKNFELKAEAILRSSFDEVLYLDSDNFPLSDVTPLFDAPLFTDPRGGRTVFWPDLNRDHPDNAIHRVLGIPCHNAWELDSGQVLIAKSGNDGLNLAALYLAQYMQTEGDYWFSGGDKDTFRYAFLALGIPYTPAPRWLALLGSILPRRGDGGDVFCGAAMLQYGIDPPRAAHAEPGSDPSHPEPLFVHANLLKHMSGVRKGLVFDRMRRLSPAQDDVRAAYGDGERGPLGGVAGGAREISGRGLCSDIWAFDEEVLGASVETVETKGAFGALMAGFEEAYGIKPGAWK